MPIKRDNNVDAAGYIQIDHLLAEADMSNLKINRDAQEDLIMSTDALFAIFYDEPYLDDSCEEEIKALQSKYTR